MAYVPFTAYSEDPINASAGVYIHDDTDPRGSIVHVFGEATFVDTSALESMIAGAVRIGRPVVVDLRECRYMDCATIGVFVRAAKGLGDQLRLVIPRRGQGYRMLELTGLTRALHLFETLDDAVAPIREAFTRPRLRSV
jgi:anti-anti-sigma factor